MNPVDHNPVLQTASKFVNNTSRHIFLTGRAGTGKTTFLKYIRDNTFKNTVVAAPTGIAAINAGGVTLHSLFHLPFGAFIPTDEFKDDEDRDIQINTPARLIADFRMNNVKRQILKEMELLIIDEVSMLRADLLDAVDTVLRHVRKKKSTPFGGVQIIFIGDLLQLPPVVKNEEKEYLEPYYPDMYFFSAGSLKDNMPLYLELEKIYRQTDKEFISILNNLRNNRIMENDMEILNKYYKPSFSAEANEGYIHLTTHNKDADEINRAALHKLPHRSFFYEADIDGEFSEYAYPVEYNLELKKNAQVMFIKNDPTGEGRFFNGKIGKISKLDHEFIEVDFDDSSDSVIVEQYTWENKKYSLNKETGEIEDEVTGVFIQYPVKLAWAVTVHKSQGLTFEKAIIDVSRAFAPGQIYVALSRLTSLDGLVLTGKIPYRVPGRHRSVIEFAETRKDPGTLNKIMETSTQEYVRELSMQAYDLQPLCDHFKFHAGSYTKDVVRSAKQKYHSWAKQLYNDLLKEKETMDKFMEQLKRISQCLDKEALMFLHKRINAAQEYFYPRLLGFSERIISHTEIVKKEKKIKKYLGELGEAEMYVFRQQKLMRKACFLVDSVLKGNDPKKDDFLESPVFKEREKMIREMSGKKMSRAKTKNEAQSKSRKQKANTREISYNLYKEGKSIKDIAVERSLKESTIETHLSGYIRLGKIDVAELVDKKKINKIVAASELLETKHVKPIKEELGDNFSYSEIKNVMASLEFSQERD